MTTAERYVELCLRIGRHDEDLVDFSFAPGEISDRVAGEDPIEAARLAEDARELAAETDSHYLRAQLRGLEIVARKLAGEDVSYAEEVEGCYGSKVALVPEERFEQAHRELDELLPPGGTLAERYTRWLDGEPIPRERLEAVLRTLAEALRETTRELFGLPDGEAYALELVKDQHWYAYNRYLGGLRSVVEVNTDLPISAGGVVATMAHELYPGHHTERVWKEELLYRAGGRVEESVLPYGTPQSVITEGIATVAVTLMVESHGALLADAFREHGIDYDPDRSLRIHRAGKALDAVIANAAVMLHADGASTDEAVEYVQRWELISEARARQHVEFVMDRWGRAYIRTYTDGYELCRTWVGGDPARFKRLLTEQLTPTDLM
ncbi:MAG TPA: hypothetical protein VH968_11130 [Gaiellaceae bacterium]|jgi:hypothetical protein